MLELTQKDDAFRARSEWDRVLAPFADCVAVSGLRLTALDLVQS